MYDNMICKRECVTFLIHGVFTAAQYSHEETI